MVFREKVSQFAEELWRAPAHAVQSRTTFNHPGHHFCRLPGISRRGFPIRTCKDDSDGN